MLLCGIRTGYGDGKVFHVATIIPWRVHKINVPTNRKNFGHNNSSPPTTQPSRKQKQKTKTKIVEYVLENLIGI